MSSNQLLTQNQLALINAWASEPLETACNKCGDESLIEARKDLQANVSRAQHDLRNLIDLVPIVSLQNPMGWSYEPMGLVTAQTVTGTGIFSDVTSAFTDLFGTQSGTYNAKLREGEDACKASLRLQAIEQGGNAIAAVDVDYAEVGGTRAMLMVCMTGTVIRVLDCQGPLSDDLYRLSEAHQLALRTKKLQALLAAENQFV